MRSGTIFLFVLLLTLAGVGSAQDTNFPVGPQYLVTTSSTLFLHSIATPSLSLNASLPGLTGAAEESAPEPASPFVAPPKPDLTRIFWGDRSTAEPVDENPSENIIEISSAKLPRSVPVSILESGVTGMTTAQSLRERGFGASLGESAAFWKAHKPHAPRVYTNADIQQMPRS